jgi:hypothetical protein
VNKSAYLTINAALKAAPVAGATIAITGPCAENVSIAGFYNMNIGAATGKTVALTGSLSISQSANVFLYGWNVTNASGSGITVSDSRGVILENSVSSGNGSDGLNVSTLSDVTLLGTSSFDNNKEYGINVSIHSVVSFAYGSGPADVSDNNKGGIWISQGSMLNGFGGLTVAGNGVGGDPTSTSGYGIDIFGASVVQFGDCTGSNVFKNNAFGGVSVQENSEFSQWECSTGHSQVVDSNGPVGVTVGLGGEATLDAVQITGHNGPAVDVVSHATVYSVGETISHNGSPTVAYGAAVSVTGGSHAVLKSSQISSTIGPAIAAGLGSTVHFKQMTFSGNGGGIILCDSSSYLWTDLAASGTQTSLLGCTIPSAPPVGGGVSPLRFNKPDTSALRRREAEYHRRVSQALSAGPTSLPGSD